MAKSIRPVLLAFAVCLFSAPAARAAGPGCVSACVECQTLYATDLEGRLFKIDPSTASATFIGYTTAQLLDLGISSDGYLFGSGTQVSGSTSIWRLSACDASDCLDGSLPGGPNSLGGDVGTTDLYSAGPPLARVVSGTPYTSTTIGGSIGGGAGQWCGLPSGDVAVDPAAATNIYIALSGCTSLCPTGADMLARLDTATGLATNMGCLTESGSPVSGVFGLTFDGGTLYGLTNPTGGRLLHIVKSTGAVTSFPMTGGLVTATGLASIACPPQCSPDLGIPALDCGVIPGPCGIPPYSGGSTLVTNCGADVCLYANASDDCGVLSVETTQMPVIHGISPTGTPIAVKYTESFSTPGVYTIEWQATDSHGNAATCSATVDARCDHCTQLPADCTNWWRLDEPASPAIDSAGSTADNGAHGGTPLPSPGKVDGALCFDGSPDQVGVPDSAELDFPGTAAFGLAQDFTIDLWVQTSEIPGRQMLLDKRSFEQSSILGYAVFLDDGFLGLELADGSVPFVVPCGSNPATSPCTEWVAPSGNVNDGQWHFLAVTVERLTPTGGRLWVDGALVLTFDPTVRHGNLASLAPLRIAKEQTGFGSAGFLGCLDEIEYFSRALTTAEVETLHRADDEGKCKCAPPVLSGPCPIGQQEYDPDADGCMEACICDAALLGECSTCPSTAGTCNPTGLDCPGNAILRDANCDCVYDGCTPCPAGTHPKDTDGDGCEDICDCSKLIHLTLSLSAVLWVPQPPLTTVDVVYGSVGTLKSSRGDFALATIGCVRNDAQGNSAPFAPNPATGEGFWFLARPVTSAGIGGYDSLDALHEGRDPGIAASGNDCAP